MPLNVVAAVCGSKENIARKTGVNYAIRAEKMSMSHHFWYNRCDALVAFRLLRLLQWRRTEMERCLNVVHSGLLFRRKTGFRSGKRSKLG